MKVGDLVQFSDWKGKREGVPATTGIIIKGITMADWVYVLWADGKEPEATAKDDLRII